MTAEQELKLVTSRLDARGQGHHPVSRRQGPRCGGDAHLSALPAHQMRILILLRSHRWNDVSDMIAVVSQIATLFAQDGSRSVELSRSTRFVSLKRASHGLFGADQRRVLCAGSIQSTRESVEFAPRQSRSPTGFLWPCGLGTRTSPGHAVFGRWDKCNYLSGIEIAVLKSSWMMRRSRRSAVK